MKKGEKAVSEKDQRLELRRLLFDEGAADDGKVTPDDVAKYLRLSARSRHAFCHYTSLKAANSIFGSERLWLTRMDLLNDMKECQKNPELKKRTYVASFAATPKESVAMWWMYGLAGQEENPENRPQGSAPARIPVRLVLKGVSLKKLVQGFQKNPNGVAQAEEEEQQTGKTVAKVPRKQSEGGTPLKVERIEFFDVLYVAPLRTTANGVPLNGQVFWNGRHTSRRRFKNRLEKGAAVLDGFLKDAGWEYEGETRIAIVLDESEAERCDALEHISIPLGAALEDAELYVGPGRYAKEWLKACKKDFKHAKKLKSKAILTSDYEIRFRKES